MDPSLRPFEDVHLMNTLLSEDRVLAQAAAVTMGSHELDELEEKIFEVKTQAAKQTDNALMEARAAKAEASKANSAFQDQSAMAKGLKDELERTKIGAGEWQKLFAADASQFNIQFRLFSEMSKLIQ